MLKDLTQQPNEEKYLIFKLFGGGYCNQLFTLETAIYLSNILKTGFLLGLELNLCIDIFHS